MSTWWYFSYREGRGGGRTAFLPPERVLYSNVSICKCSRPLLGAFSQASTGQRNSVYVFEVVRAPPKILIVKLRVFVTRAFLTLPQLGVVFKIRLASPALPWRKNRAVYKDLTRGLNLASLRHGALVKSATTDTAYSDACLSYLRVVNAAQHSRKRSDHTKNNYSA